MKNTFLVVCTLSFLQIFSQPIFAATSLVQDRDILTDGNIHVVLDVKDLDKAEVVQALLLAARPDAYTYRPYGHAHGTDTLIIDAVEDVSVPETLKDMRTFLEDCIYYIDEKKHIALVDGCNLGRTFNLYISLDENTLHIIYLNPEKDPFYTETWVEAVVGCLQNIYEENPLSNSYPQPSWIQQWLGWFGMFLSYQNEETGITGPLNIEGSHAKVCAQSWMNPARKHYLEACEKAVQRMGNTVREFSIGRPIPSKQLLEVLDRKGPKENPELLLHSYIFEQPVTQPAFVDQETSPQSKENTGEEPWRIIFFARTPPLRAYR